MTLVDFHHVEFAPPPPANSTCPHTHIQTGGDYTKRVVTPLGTTRLKTLENSLRVTRLRGCIATTPRTTEA